MLPQGIALVSVSTTPVFQATGTATGSVLITLQNAHGKTKQVTVSVAGAIKMG
jgi:hypothetical protein